MTVYRIPENPKAVLFDIDSTLYTNPEYAAFQVEVLIRELASRRSVPLEKMRLEVQSARDRISEKTGKATSLGNAMAELGVDIPTSVAWRERLIRPRDWLRRDEKLVEALDALKDRLSLAAVTNNPRSVGSASLDALGVRAFFRAVVGLDDTMVSKPAREPFELAARLLDAPVSSCISVGDRWDVDLAVPLDLGMGAVLVVGVQDVYRLLEELTGLGRA